MAGLVQNGQHQQYEQPQQCDVRTHSVAEFRLFTTWLLTTRDGGKGFYSLKLQMLRCCFVALASASVFLFVVAFLLKFLSLSLSPFFLCSCLSVTKQKKAKEMHLITQSAVMLLSLLSHLSGQHCVALSPPTLLSHSHSLTPFAAERKKERESESELACRTHGQWVQREEGVQWRGLSETDSDTLRALLQKPRLFGECNVRVRKKNQFK